MSDDNKLLGLSEETLKQFLFEQAHERELKAQEIEVRREEVNVQMMLARETLQAQITDRENERNHTHRENKIRLIFAAIVLLASFVFLGGIAWLGFAKETLDVVKLAIGAVFGAFGGYGYKAVKDKHKSPVDN